jgi:hypothetical protein
MGRRESQRRVQRLAERASQRSTDTTRHRVFVSYHIDDENEVTDFIDHFGDEFIGTVVGVTDDDDFVDSDDTDYIMDQIRDRYLGKTTVTVVLIGRCTWSRKYVDWEIYASLRSYRDYLPSGLVAITLPSVADYAERTLPDRLADNVNGAQGDEGYAQWKRYPKSKTVLRGYVEEAFEGRTFRSHLIDNTRDRRTYNSSC